MIYDVIIAGAGPVGLLLANLLGKNKLKVLILEKEEAPPQTSRAIGIMPPSLKILKALDLDQEFITKGLKIQKVRIHGTKKETGWLAFNRLNYDYNFILSIPQSKTEQILEQNLKKYDTVKLLREHEVTSFKKDKELIQITALQGKNQKEETFTAKYAAACDGVKSTLRNLLEIEYVGGRYKQTFLMGDFKDSSGFLDEAHLFFTPNGSVESFPLPDGIRRWIIETPYFMENPSEDYLIGQVLERTGLQLESQTKISNSPFGVQHYIAESYSKDSIFLCGDAAHAMSPIGGQGMNTGFADAHFLATILSDFIKEDYYSEKLAQKYEQYRKKAVKSAIKRAKISMTIGTFKGSFLSFIRHILILLVIKSPLRNKAVSYFSMLTIPFGTFEKVLKREALFFKRYK